MLRKIARIVGISLSVLFLLASAGIIFWISQDEQERLALKERAGLIGNDDPEAEELARQAKADAADGIAAVDKAIRDIDTLLASISIDDLPTEE